MANGQARNKLVHANMPTLTEVRQDAWPNLETKLYRNTHATATSNGYEISKSRVYGNELTSLTICATLLASLNVNILLGRSPTNTSNTLGDGICKSRKLVALIYWQLTAPISTNSSSEKLDITTTPALFIVTRQSLQLNLQRLGEGSVCRGPSAPLLQMSCAQDCWRVSASTSRCCHAGLHCMLHSMHTERMGGRSVSERPI